MVCAFSPQTTHTHTKKISIHERSKKKPLARYIFCRNVLGRYKRQKMKKNKLNIDNGFSKITTNVKNKFRFSQIFKMLKKT